MFSVLHNNSGLLRFCLSVVLLLNVIYKYFKLFYNKLSKGGRMDFTVTAERDLGWVVRNTAGINIAPAGGSFDGWHCSNPVSIIIGFFLSLLPTLTLGVVKTGKSWSDRVIFLVNKNDFSGYLKFLENVGYSCSSGALYSMLIK